MTTQLIPHSINDRVISQRADDGYVHATAMCAAGGKRLNNYLRNSVTRDFIEALASETRIRASQLVIVKKGNSGAFKQGTWVHPKVALHLAQWISPTFAVQVVNWVYDWMNNRAVETRQQLLPPAPRMRNWHPTRAEQREINSRASALLQAHFHPVRDMIIAQMKQDRANGIVKPARDYGIRHLPAANDRKPFDHAIFVIDGQYITADCTATTYRPGDQVIAINTEDGSGPDIFTIAETAIPKSWFDRCHLANPLNSRDLIRPVVVVIGTIVKEGCNEKTRMDGDHRSDHRGIDHDGM